MKMVRHEAVRNYCELLPARDVAQGPENASDRGSVAKDRAAFVRADCHKIPMYAAILERVEPRGELEWHASPLARCVPIDHPRRT